MRGEEAALVQLHGEIEAGLSAQSGEQAVGLLFLDYALNRALCERLYVHGGGHVGVGHYSGGVGVYQHGLHALGHERAAGLRARVVKLRGLAYDYGAGADDEYLFDAVVSRH